MTAEERADQLYFNNDEMCGFLRRDWFVEKVTELANAHAIEVLTKLKTSIDEKINQTDRQGSYTLGRSIGLALAIDEIDRSIVEMNK